MQLVPMLLIVLPYYKNCRNSQAILFIYRKKYNCNIKSHDVFNYIFLVFYDSFLGAIFTICVFLIRSKIIVFPLNNLGNVARNSTEVDVTFSYSNASTDIL